MKRTDEFSKNLTEEQLIRRALLSATEEEYQEALRAVPEAPALKYTGNEAGKALVAAGPQL